MKITYLYHSCFYVELEQHILLFDYYKGELPVFDPTKALYIFVSHGHQDHYQNAIFSIDHPNRTYILSNDIQISRQERIFRMQAHECKIFDAIHVGTLASTDEGVAFLVEVEGYQLYHAGDLHWWDWRNEDTIEEARAMELAFKQEIARITKPIDIAFVPVDPRLKASYDKGIVYFMEHTKTNYVFPMHFMDAMDTVQNIRNHKKCVAFQQKIMKITHTNEEFCIIL